MTKTILVVDDIPLMRRMLVKYIKSLGLKLLKEEFGVTDVTIVEANHGRDALAVLSKYDVDLIFLDLMMPEMDGLRFLSMKQEDPKIRDIPVIVCSALGEKKTIERTRALGVSGYIVKPFTLRMVEEKLRDALNTVQQG